MKSEFEIAITQLSSDRNLAPSIIIDAIEKALASAYKRNFDSEQNVIVKLDVHTGAATVLVQKLVVEEVTDPDTQLTPDEAAQFKANAKVGDVIDFEMTPKNFGRIAAQTAKQVIMSKIRDAERDSVYLEYQDRAGEIVTGIIRNIDTHTRMVTVSLGKAEALMDVSEQIPGEVNGFCTVDGTRRIVIDADLSDAHAAKTAIHEAAHAILHTDEDGKSTTEPDQATCELEAESVAYVVAGLHGLDTSDYSVGYVASWSGGQAEKVKATAIRVQEAVHLIAEALTDETEEDAG